jgi:hypothetical protein
MNQNLPGCVAALRRALSASCQCWIGMRANRRGRRKCTTIRNRVLFVKSIPVFMPIFLIHSPNEGSGRRPPPVGRPAKGGER